jgi:hypothetical protein
MLLTDPRMIEYKRVIEAEKRVSDPLLNDVYDAILCEGDLPDGYSAVIYESFTTSYAQAYYTLVHVKTPDEKEYDLVVDTYERRNVGVYCAYK